MSIRVDFTDVGGADFQPIEPGTYNAVVFNAEVRDSQAGKPYINWDFKITGPKYEGRHQWYMTSLQKQALWKLKQMLLRLGVPEEKLTGVFDLDLEELIGKPCKIVVEHEQYQGQIRDRVVDVLPPDDEVVNAPLFR